MKATRGLIKVLENGVTMAWSRRYGDLSLQVAKKLCETLTLALDLSIGRATR